MLARLLFVSCLVFSLVYCQSCDVNSCTYNGATDRTGSSTVDITFGNDLKYTPSCVRVNPGTTINYNGAFSSHPLVAGTFSKFPFN
jgi:plastocyanin